MRYKLLAGLILFLLTFMLGIPLLADTAQQDSFADSSDKATKAQVLEAYGELPILFIQNQG